MDIHLPVTPLFEPTSDVPIVTDTMKHLLEHLDEDMCLADMMDFLEFIAKGKKDDAEEKKSQEKSSMTRILKETEMAMQLLHSIPKHLIRAAILGITGLMGQVPSTVEGHLARDIYAFDGPGTYIATIAVGGRHGKFLTGKELDELIGLLRDYLQVSYLP